MIKVYGNYEVTGTEEELPILHDLDEVDEEGAAGFWDNGNMYVLDEFVRIEKEGTGHTWAFKDDYLYGHFDGILVSLFFAAKLIKLSECGSSLKIYDCLVIDRSAPDEEII